MKKNLLTILIVLVNLCFTNALKAADVTITSAQSFASLDASDGLTDGIFNVTGNLTIANGGSINCNDVPGAGQAACPINIVVSGNMEIQAGGAIYAENRIADGNGGNISITVGGTFIMQEAASPLAGALITSSNLTATSGNMKAGDINLEITGLINLGTGSLIKANSFKGKAGEIVINSAANIDIDGSVLSQSTGTGTGTNQGHGGTINIISGIGSLNINDHGVVSSKGLDPGADLVHICGYIVRIWGLVESTGVGHGIPSNPGNHLSSPYRPDKPSNSTAGVEIWADLSLVIDNLNHNGEVKADLCCGGGSTGFSWVDLFSNGSITIIGGSTDTRFAVHANGQAGSSDIGGLINVKSKQANINVSGYGIMANGTSDGGEMNIEARFDVNLNNAVLYAQGDINPTGGFGSGGKINIRSFNNSISWQNGIGDVRPTGTHVSLPPAKRGEINFTKCLGGSVDISGSVFPDNGLPATTPTTLPDACGGEPSLAEYVSFCGSASPLPINIASFYAKRNNVLVNLTWKTATEINAKAFILQRKINGNFEDIATVPARNISNGANYSYSDNNQTKSVSEYRIKMVDFDDKSAYSETRNVKGISTVSDFNIYPNPSNGNSKVTVTDIGDPTDVQVIDNSGRIIKTVSLNNSNTVALPNLQKGLYMIRVVNKTSGESQTKKLTVVN